MDFNKIIQKIKDLAGLCGDFVFKYKRYFLAGFVFVCMNLVLFLGTSDKSTDTKSTAGVYKDYKENNNKELDKLVKDYFKAYQDGDTDTIKKLATPICDKEEAYIKFLSDYVESYNDIEIFTKEGLTKDSYLVSVTVEVKYKDIDTTAPGLDFFYIEKNKDGKLYINNLYGTFNQKNNVYEMDTDVSDLISVFIRQPDVLEKNATISDKCEKALASDSALDTLFNQTLKTAIVQFNNDYEAKVAADEAAKAEEEAKAAEEAAKAEEEAKAKEEEEAKAAAEKEEKENSYEGKINSRANVREKADKDSEHLGSIDKGKTITIYGEEGDFYKFDFEGTTAYITKDAVTVKSTDETDNQETTEEETQSVGSFEKGTKITIKKTTNIRSKMDTSSSKVAVAYSGDTVEVVMSYAEGWTKVKYKKTEGFIRTDLLQ